MALEHAMPLTIVLLSQTGGLCQGKRALIIWNSDVLGKREALEMIGGTLGGKGHPGSHVTTHVSF